VRLAPLLRPIIEIAYRHLWRDWAERSAHRQGVAGTAAVIAMARQRRLIYSDQAVLERCDE
jgi:hypothetical protein